MNLLLTGMPKEDSSAVFEDRMNLPRNTQSQRLRYLDQFRGYIICYLVIMAIWPAPEWRQREFNIFLHYMFSHAPPNSTYMTYYDVGALAFLFILGMLLNVSYQRRMDKLGRKKAILHAVTRYGGLFLIGVMIVVFENRLYSYDSGYVIIGVDLFTSIAIAGTITFITARLVKNLYIRVVFGYFLCLIYQILLVTTFFKWYAEHSVHGGVFGTIFGWTSACIIASAVGDYIISSEHKETTKFRNFSIFCILNLAIGIGISFIPGWEASKNQVSLAYVLISIGITCGHILIFAIFDKILNWDIAYLRAFGKNPLFMYFLIGFPIFALQETVGIDFGIPIWGNFISLVILLPCISLIGLFLYKKDKSISSTLTAIIIGILGTISIIIWFFFR